jgi:hypothetical protein
MRRRFGAFTDGGFGPRPPLASRKFTRYHVLWVATDRQVRAECRCRNQVAMPVPYEGRRLIVALLVVLALLAFTAYWWFDMR